MWSVLRSDLLARGSQDLVLGQTGWMLWPRSGQVLSGEARDWRSAFHEARRVFDAKASVRVWLTASMVCTYFARPPSGLRSGEEWRSWSLADARSRLSPADRDQELTVWAAADKPQPSLMVAMRRNIRDALTADASRGQLRSIQPLWAACFAAARTDLRSVQLLSIHEAEGVLVLEANESGELTDAATHAAGAEAGLRRRSILLSKEQYLSATWRTKSPQGSVAENWLLERSA